MIRGQKGYSKIRISELLSCSAAQMEEAVLGSTGCILNGRGQGESCVGPGRRALHMHVFIYCYVV